MRTSLLVLGLLVLSVSPTVLDASTAVQPPAAGQALGAQGLRPIRARLWVEGERDSYRRGERMQIHFSTSDDAYVALLHIDTEGNLDFLFPFSPWDDALVRGGRVYTLPRGYQSGWTVRGEPGIGYLYLIASPVPLDYGPFAGYRGSAWDWSYGGRVVRGDPFWAFEQITRLLLPDWHYVPFAVDYYSYHIGGRHRYPAYACADRYYDARVRTWGWNQYYGPCDRLDRFLYEHPYYYDARLYRGDRRAYLRELGPSEPLHHYKEDADWIRPNDGWMQRREPPRPRARGVLPEQTGRTVRPESSSPAPEPGAPVRRRPTLERRSGESGAQGVTRGTAPQPERSGRTGVPITRRRPGGGS